MPEIPQTRCAGLVTTNNPLRSQEGSLIKAENAVINRDDVIENRRGHNDYMALSNEPTQIMVYNNRPIIHNSTTMTYDSDSGYFDGAGTASNYSGSYTAPSGRKMRSQENKSNLYITTNAGIKVFMDLAGTAARSAGVPKCLDPLLISGTTPYDLVGGSGFLDNNKQCAYRFLLAKTDQNNNILYGSPSGRCWVVNTAGASRNVQLRIALRSDTIAGDTFQAYRTSSYTYSAGSPSDDSGDELGLVYTYTITSTDITNGYVGFTDSIIDALRGATLYTSPSQEGIGQANDIAPIAKDLTLYKSLYMFYANTVTKQRLYVTIVGTTNLYNGGSYGRSVILAGTTYTSAATETIASGQFAVSNSGNNAIDIDNTARSLVRVINRYSSNTSVYAYYISGSGSGTTDLPGKILIEERSLGGSVFSIHTGVSATSNDFSPPPPTSSSTTGLSASSNETKVNRIYFSKSALPEAVPAINFIDVGSSNAAILRILSLRDSLIILKEDGVFRLTGETPISFSVVPLDLTVFCKAIDSATVLSNRVFCLSNQGIVAINDTSAEVISRDIDPNIQPILRYSTLNTYTYGIAYESERSYLLSTISSSGDTSANQTFIYNIFTRAWTKWTYGFTCGVIEPSIDRLFLAKPSKSVLYVERKDFASTDYSDPDLSITIDSISGTTITITCTTGVPKVGDKIKQGATSIKIISLSVNPILSSQYICIVASTPPGSWSAASATLLVSIAFDIEWNAFDAGNAGLLKQVQEVKILTDNISSNNTVSALKATFRTDLDNSRELVEIDSSSFGWGTMPFGSSPWGGRSETFNYRTYVPQRKHYCRIMNAGVIHSIANERISVNGISYNVDAVSERTTR